MRADTWDGSRIACCICGRESPHPGGLARHVRSAHAMSLFDYYADHPHQLIDRIHRTADLDVRAPDLGPCWVVRGRSLHGYRTMRVAGAPTPFAHRLAVWADTGVMPAELVLHQCDVRACANPEHLRAGTHAENMAERTERERVCRGVDVHTAKLDEDAVQAIRALHRDGGCSYATLAAEFGVSASAIGHVVKRRSFAWLPDPELDAGFIPW